jgi:D-sedoheptulose 7-phosphate isomerase
MSYTKTFLTEAGRIIEALDTQVVEHMVEAICRVRDAGGRLFFLGVGGGAGHAGHAVNDFRKIAGIECYAPTDNVSELTARINDDGWDSAYRNWLEISRLNERDAVFVFSVGGGREDAGVSVCLVEALKFAKAAGASVLGIVGKDGGYTASVADACVIIPSFDPKSVTPQTEGFQAVVWHLVVSHPALQRHAMKWESMPAEESPRQ